MPKLIKTLALLAATLRVTSHESQAFIVVRETASIHGGGFVADFAAKCPEDLRGAIFDSGRPDVPWYRKQRFRLERSLT